MIAAASSRSCFDTFEGVLYHDSCPICHVVICDTEAPAKNVVMARKRRLVKAGRPRNSGVGALMMVDTA